MLKNKDKKKTLDQKNYIITLRKAKVFYLCSPKKSHITVEDTRDGCERNGKKQNKRQIKKSN